MIILCSCRKLVQDEFPDFSNKPTINCILIEGKTIKVHLSLAQKIDAHPNQVLSNAKVYLYSDSVSVEKLSYTENGIYISSITAEAGKVYRLSIDIPSFPIIEKNIRIPEPERIISVQHFKSAGASENGDIIPAVRITFSNQIRERKFYQIILKYIPDYHGAEIGYAFPANITDPILLNESLPIWVFSNEKILDTTYSIFIQYMTNSANSSLFSLIVELRTIDEAYYHYLKSLYLYERGRFDSYIGEVFPIFPVYSNVQNAYGIMGAFSSYSFDTINPNKQ